MNEERIIQKTSKGQYTITLPIQIVRALGWKKGDTIQIILDAGDIRLRKTPE